MIEIGKEYIFFYRHDDGDSEGLVPYNAHKCKVCIENKNKDYSQYNGSFEVEFEDGSEFDVYGDELCELEKCSVSKYGIYWL